MIIEKLDISILPLSGLRGVVRQDGVLFRKKMTMMGCGSINYCIIFYCTRTVGGYSMDEAPVGVDKLIRQIWGLMSP